LDNRFVQMNMILKKWAKVNHVVDPRFFLFYFKYWIELKNIFLTSL